MVRAKLLESKNWVDIYVLSRLFYSMGKPIISDEVYDKIEGAIKKAQPSNEYLTRTYDDDPFPTELLEKWGFNVRVIERAYYSPKSFSTYELHSKEMDEEFSKSITPVETYLEAIEWLDKIKDGEEIVASLKIDGINTKNFYKEGKYKVSATRGRGGTPFDISKNTSRILPATVERQGNVFVRGEAIITKQGLEEMNKAGIDFKTCRSAAMSVLRKDISSEWYKYLEIVSFKTNGHNTLTSSLEELKDNNFTVVPYRVVKKIKSKDREEIIDWLNNIMEELWEEGLEKGYPSDGVVLEINNQALFNSKGEDTKYNFGNIALKIGRWKPGYYKGVITGIEIEQQKSKCSVVGLIEPVKLDNGITVSRVNLFNLDIMISNGINIGSEIDFEYKSESSVNLIYE